MADKNTEMKTAEIKLHILEPRATEKTYMEQTKRTYVFSVKRNMSKQAIKALVEDEFNVKVTDVRTLIRNGKETKYSKGKHAYPGITHRQDKKYAYVTLAEGNSIKVFEEQNDNKTSAKEADKKDKKADKNAGKENK